MNTTVAKYMINNGELISTLEMINIIDAFRRGLWAIGPDLKKDPKYSEDEVFAIVGADWALDVLTKKLIFDLDKD